jgi:hypothetical protein
MKSSVLTNPKLVGIQLLATNCELKQESGITTVKLGLSHEVNFHPGEEQKFNIVTNTKISGRDMQKNELMELTCCFRAGYTFSDRSISVEDLKSATEHFGFQIFPTVRAHIVNLMAMMGINAVSVPFCLDSPEPAEAKKKVPKKRNNPTPVR